MTDSHRGALQPPPPVACPPTLGHRRMQSAPHAIVIGIEARQGPHQLPAPGQVASIAVRSRRASTISTPEQGAFMPQAFNNDALSYRCEDRREVGVQPQMGLSHDIRLSCMQRSSVQRIGGWRQGSTGAQCSTAMWQRPTEAIQLSTPPASAIRHTQEHKALVGPEQCEWRASWDVI
ncbi:hypothetical protein H4S04_007030 [Coemansia sp. S16]|nr:hypothetical protein H4S04_007030 [Coemansia sp. S16]KAJ2054746.1 hypothetical protein GGI08_004436 [Coemansia sp. S2]